MDKISIRKNPKKFKTFIIIFVVVVVIGIGANAFISGARNIFLNRCDIRARTLSTNIINKVVLDNMTDLNYNDLLIYERDSNDNITMVRLNSVIINKLSACISKEIQEGLTSLSQTSIKIRLGAALKNEMFREVRSTNRC